MVTFDPAVTQSDPSQQQVIDWDIRLGHRLLSTGSLHPKIGRYKFVSSFAPMIARIEAEYEKTGKAQDVSFDLETMGFHPWYSDREIVTVQFTFERGTAEVLYVGSHQIPPVRMDSDGGEDRWREIHWLLNSPKVKLRGANAKFDLVWVAAQWGIECTNFSFDTLLVGSLLDENRSNSLNLHAKIFTPMGGYDDCVTPDTRICTADLRWVPIGEVEPGDKLLGFDEQVVEGCRRKMQVAEAISTKRLVKRGVLVKFDNGTEIKCSFDHGFLAHVRKTGNGPYAWVRARELVPGARVLLVVPVEDEVLTKDAGYLAGLYDGEGFVSFDGGGLTSGISQKPGCVWARYTDLMVKHGLGGYYSMQKNGDGVHTSKLTGWPTLRMLQLFRPERLLAKQPFAGKCVPSGAPQVRVLSVEWLDDIEVVSLTTSTHTFVAEGIASHNSFNRTFDKGHMERIRPDKLLNYAGGDTDATQTTADVLREQLLEDPELTRFYLTIVHPASRAFEKIERRGICLDAEIYRTLGVDLTKEIEGLTRKAMQQLGGRLLNKHTVKIGKQIDTDKSPLVPSILRDYFFSPQGLNLKPKVITPKEGIPTLAMSHLKMFDHPDAKAMVEILTALNGATKTKSTFVDGFLNHMRPDGRLHPSYMLFHGAFNDEADEESGTVTGRLAAKDPAIQTLPKKTKWAKRLREAFIAPLGKCVLNLDFSQGELRVVACLAPEPTMLAAYEKNLDLHAVTGAKLGGYPIEEFMKMNGTKEHPTPPDQQALFDKLRGNAKPMNFGLLYGMSVEGFQRYAWALYGKAFSLPECEEMHSAFFELYAGLPNYHEYMKMQVNSCAQVRSPLGRIRHLPHIYSFDREVRSTAQRQAINSPVQSTLTDMMIWALALIEREYGHNPDLEVVAMIHDALVAYVPIEDAALWAKRLSGIMSNLPFHELDWKPQLKFPADAEAGPNLASLSKIKLAA